jgi:hypothetical protein
MILQCFHKTARSLNRKCDTFDYNLKKTLEETGGNILAGDEDLSSNLVLSFR